MGAIPGGRVRRLFPYAVAFLVGGSALAAGLVVIELLLGAPNPLDQPGKPIGSIEIIGSDYGYFPASIKVAAPGRYAVTFTNQGRLDHNVTFNDGTTIAADGGSTATGEVTVPAGGMSFECSVPFHSEKGMIGTIRTDHE